MNKPTFEQVLKEIRMTNVAIGENEYSEKSFGSWYIVQEETEEKVQGFDGWRDIWIDRHPKHNSDLAGIEKFLGSARA